MLENVVRVTIHRERLRQNVRWLRQRHPRLMPVIKADAYGHGVECTAGVMFEEGVDTLAVGTVFEAFHLRQMGVQGRLVAFMGLLPGDDVHALSPAGILPLIHSQACLERLAIPGQPRLSVALKVDTGMSRLGFAPEELPAVMEFFRDHPGLRVDLLVSHLASADDPGQDAYTVGQAQLFFAALDVVRQVFPHVESSLANSAGILRWTEFMDLCPALPDHPGDYGRPGLSVYGANPLCGTEQVYKGYGLLPVMEVSTTVLAVHPLPAGHCASYGCTFTAPHDMTVAVIAIGYADGYPRSLSSRGSVWFEDRLLPLVGRVCMQMSLVDVTAAPHIRAGDTVWLLGSGPAVSGSAGFGSAPHTGPVGVDACNLALAANTVAYELVCQLGRNQRIVVD